nr:hypothetical protein [uncultured Rahnella sp.]
MKKSRFTEEQIVFALKQVMLDVPVAYFYAEEDELAALIIEFHESKKQS